MLVSLTRPAKIVAHAEGTCHFCRDAAAEFLPHLGAYYDGCPQGAGVLRVWYLNSVFRPSGPCPCTEACDAFDAEDGINRSSWKVY